LVNRSASISSARGCARELIGRRRFERYGEVNGVLIAMTTAIT
jgi:hypothetical protein